MVVKGAFGPKVCPQVQIGRDSVSASAISASTNTPIIGKAKTLHAALQAASCFWKQSVSAQLWICPGMTMKVIREPTAGTLPNTNSLRSYPGVLSQESPFPRKSTIDF
jgi:hypothetical protein